MSLINQLNATTEYYWLQTDPVDILNKASALVWKLMGKVMTRKWDGDVDKKQASIVRRGGHGKLTEKEMRTIIEWIDTGALWNGVP